MNFSNVHKSQLKNGKPLTKQLIFTKTRNDNLSGIKNLNLWGNDLQDLSLLDQMPNLQVISLSVNNIKTLKYFTNCNKLQELYLRKNDIKTLQQLEYIINLPNLRVLWLHDNPCANTKNYRQLVLMKLPHLVKLDNDPVSEEQLLRLKKKLTNSIGSNKRDDRESQNVQISKSNSNQHQQILHQHQQQQQPSIKPLVPNNNNFLVNLQQNQSSFQLQDNFTSDRKTLSINQSSPTKVSNSSRNQASFENFDSIKKQQDFYKYQKNFNPQQQRKPQPSNNNQPYIQQQRKIPMTNSRGNYNQYIPRSSQRNQPTQQPQPKYPAQTFQKQIKNQLTTPKHNYQSYDNYSSIKKDYRVQSSPMSPSSPHSHTDSRMKKKSNILMAVLALVEQLDNDSLEIVRREITKKLI